MDRVNELVKQCDADGDGKVSAQEYVDAAAAGVVPRSWLGTVANTLSRRFSVKNKRVTLSDADVTRLKKAFQDADVDESGSLDADEVHAALRKHAPDLTRAQASELVSKADVDGNGELDWEEFLAVVARSRLDRNANSWWRRWLFPEAAPKDLASEQDAFYEDIFRKLDEDGDGVVRPGDLAKALDDLGVPASLPACEKMVKDAGGALTLKRFLETMRVRRADLPLMDRIVPGDACAAGAAWIVGWDDERARARALERKQIASAPVDAAAAATWIFRRDASRRRRGYSDVDIPRRRHGRKTFARDQAPAGTRSAPRRNAGSSGGSGGWRRRSTRSPPSRKNRIRASSARARVSRLNSSSATRPCLKRLTRTRRASSTRRRCRRV